MKILVISIAFVNCLTHKDPPLDRNTVVKNFCFKLEQCTTAKYDVCVKSTQDTKVQDEQGELKKLVDFTNKSTCKDLWLLVYQYQAK